MTEEKDQKNFIQEVNAAVKVQMRSDRSESEIQTNLNKSIDMFVNKYIKEEK